MNDKEASEKDIFEDLDKMYQRVADVEKEEAAEASMHTVHKKEKPQPKKKRSSRPMIIVAVIVWMILAGILAFPFLKQMIAPLLPKTSKTPPPLVATPPVPKAKPSVPLPVPKDQEPSKTIPEQVEKPKPVPPAPLPVPKDQEAMKIPPKEVEKTKPVPQEIKKAGKPLPQEKYYTIQIGAFRNLKPARDLLEILKKDGLDAFLTRLEGKKRGTFYKVFVGHFTDEKEGTLFLKENWILNDYPGSFVRKGPSFEVHQLIEGKISM